MSVMLHTSFSPGIIVAFFLLCFNDVGVKSKVYNLGVVVPWTGFYAVGKRSGGAVTLAVEKVNEDNETFRKIHEDGHSLKFIWEDDECSESIGLPLVAEMAIGRDEPVDVFIGPGCSVVCEPAGHLVSHWNIPMVSWGCSSTKLSDKSVYNTFARTTAPNSNSAPFYVDILTDFEYNRTVIYHSSEHIWTLTAIALKDIFFDNNIEVTDYMFERDFKIGSNVYESLQTTMQESRGKIHKIRFTYCPYTTLFTRCVTQTCLKK